MTVEEIAIEQITAEFMTWFRAERLDGKVTHDQVTLLAKAYAEGFNYAVRAMSWLVTP